MLSCTLKWRKVKCRLLQNLFEDAWREKRVAIKSIKAVEGCVRKVAAENAAQAPVCGPVFRPAVVLASSVRLTHFAIWGLAKVTP